MSLDTKDILDAIFRLLPGFVAAWTFFGLTGYKPRSPFERIIHALILTAIITGMVICLREFLLWIGTYVSIGTWNSDTQIAISFFVALVLGVGLASAAHNDIPHKWFRALDHSPNDGPRFWRFVARMRITRNRAEPSEWYGAFAEIPPRWITLHLKGGRRLYGWPRGWPNSSRRGHFVIEHPRWLLDNGEQAPLHGVKALLVDASTVEMVEILNYPVEIAVPEDELLRVQRALIELQEKPDASKATASATTETHTAASVGARNDPGGQLSSAPNGARTSAATAATAAEEKLNGGSLSDK